MRSESEEKTLVVLAAGLGSRFGGDKQINGVGPNGEFLLEYSVYDAWRAGFQRFVIVVNAAVEHQVKERLAPIVGIDRLFLLVQPLPTLRTKPWGTGHAVLSVRQHVHGPFMVVNGDDFYGRLTFELAAAYIDSGQINAQHYGMIVYPLKNTLSENGPVSRGICSVNAENMLLQIEEQTGIQRQANGEITSCDTSMKMYDHTSVSMNCWLFDPSVFHLLDGEFNHFLEVNREHNSAEFYLPSAIQTALSTKNVSVHVIHTTSHWCGLTYAQDRSEVQDFLLGLTNQGVYPKKLPHG
jgi:UTP-glucose-1-phosphate uridylyltransferase